jgi:hypothetical protein
VADGIDQDVSRPARPYNAYYDVDESMWTDSMVRHNRTNVENSNPEMSPEEVDAALIHLWMAPPDYSTSAPDSEAGRGPIYTPPAEGGETAPAPETPRGGYVRPQETFTPATGFTEKGGIRTPIGGGESLGQPIPDDPSEMQLARPDLRGGSTGPATQLQVAALRDGRQAPKISQKALPEGAVSRIQNAAIGNERNAAAAEAAALSGELRNGNR